MYTYRMTIWIPVPIPELPSSETPWAKAAATGSECPMMRAVEGVGPQRQTCGSLMTIATAAAPAACRAWMVLMDAKIPLRYGSLSCLGGNPSRVGRPHCKATTQTSFDRHKAHHDAFPLNRHRNTKKRAVDVIKPRPPLVA